MSDELIDYANFDLKTLLSWQEEVDSTERIDRAREMEERIRAHVSLLGHQLNAARRVLESAQAHVALAKIARPDGAIRCSDVLDPKILLSVTETCTKAKELGYRFAVWNNAVIDVQTMADTGLGRADLF